MYIGAAAATAIGVHDQVRLWLTASLDGQYDEFQGQIIVVDIATINGKTEDFEGRTWLENHCLNRQPVGCALQSGCWMAIQD